MGVPPQSRRHLVFCFPIPYLPPGLHGTVSPMKAGPWGAVVCRPPATRGQCSARRPKGPQTGADGVELGLVWLARPEQTLPMGREEKWLPPRVPTSCTRRPPSSTSQSASPPEKNDVQRAGSLKTFLLLDLKLLFTTPSSDTERGSRPGFRAQKALGRRAGPGPTGAAMASFPRRTRHPCAELRALPPAVP